MNKWKEFHHLGHEQFRCGTSVPPAEWKGFFYWLKRKESSRGGSGWGGTA